MTQDNSPYEKKLESLRLEINKHDLQLLKILKSRFSVVKKIAELKSKHNLSILQKKRWESIINDRIKQGKKFGLDIMLTKKLMDLIHKESIRLQLLVKNKNKSITKDKKLKG